MKPGLATAVGLLVAVGLVQPSLGEDGGMRLRRQLEGENPAAPAAPPSDAMKPEAGDAPPMESGSPGSGDEYYRGGGWYGGGYPGGWYGGYPGGWRRWHGGYPGGWHGGWRWHGGGGGHGGW